MKSYKIKKNSHYSTCTFPRFTFNSKFNFTLIFTNSCKYDHINSDSDDWNKAYGFSDSWSFHHNNSARIGWRYRNNRIELCTYVYMGKQRLVFPITTTKINTLVQCSIEVDTNSYLFTVNGIIHRVPRTPNRIGGLKYMLKPYFGGNNSAPHDITILLEY